MNEQLGFPGMPDREEEPSDWRAHTAERWLRDDPDGYAHCVEQIRCGVANKSELSRQFGRSRNSIHALMMREFSVEQLNDIIARSAAITTAEAVAKTDDLVGKATVKDLGSVAMALRVANEVKQLTSGQPTEIKENRVRLTVEDFMRLSGTGSQPENARTLPPGGPILDLPSELSDEPPLSQTDVTRSKSTMAAAVMLLFMPVSTVFLKWGGGGSDPARACPVITSHALKNY